MTKLPAKALLDGTKNPETTTGEFRLAMGNIRQFLFELFGDESSDKETARQTLGIDITVLNDGIASKADKQTVEAALDEKADKNDLSLVATTGDYNHLVNKPIVSGMIIMWSGSESAIPDGWALCNGENGTPDLRDRFIVGAGSSCAAGTSGGNASQTIDLSGQTGSTTLTINQIPSHSHMIAGASGVTGSSNMEIVPISIEGLNSYGSKWSQAYSRESGGNQPHSHGLSGSATVNMLPPYYALCFIIKL